MPTLVLSHRYSPDSNALFSAALAAGWDVERLHSFRCPDGLAALGLVFYGETLLADAVANELAIALLEPTADWLPQLPERHRLRDVHLTTLGEALAIRERVFVKPTDEKCFPARVYADGPSIAPDPVVFEVEFRFFVLERGVGAFSPYIRHGEIARSAAGDWEATPAEVEAATSALRAVLADPEVNLPPAVVMDVGLIEGRGWGVVEANPAWASGALRLRPRGRLACAPAGDCAAWRGA